MKKLLGVFLLLSFFSTREVSSARLLERFKRKETSIKLVESILSGKKSQSTKYEILEESIINEAVRSFGETVFFCSHNEKVDFLKTIIEYVIHQSKEGESEEILLDLAMCLFNGCKNFKSPKIIRFDILHKYPETLTNLIKKLLSRKSYRLYLKYNIEEQVKYSNEYFTESSILRLIEKSIIDQDPEKTIRRSAIDYGEDTSLL